MGIDHTFTETITVKSVTQEFNGTKTYETLGTCKGSHRRLKYSERVSTDKQSLFSTDRFNMDKTIVPVYGNYLEWNGKNYAVKFVDDHEMSGGFFQTVDTELIE